MSASGILQSPGVDAIGVCEPQKLMKNYFLTRDFSLTLGLAFCTAVLSSVFFWISDVLFGIRWGYVLGSGIEEILKFGLFIFFPKRAFYAVIFFALFEIVLVKIPLFCYSNFECFSYGVIFSALGLVFHVSTALLYKQIFSIRLSAPFFMELCLRQFRST